MSENNELVIETLNKRLAALEAEVSRLKKTSSAVREAVLAAICAAVSTYLGKDGEVKADRFAPSETWVRQGRRAQQNHSIR